jgi:putative endonuclease
MAKYWVYILESLRDKWTYTGHTKNLQYRLKLHNSGKMKSTRAHAPFRLAYTEEHKNRSEAMQKERFLKSGRGRTIREALIAKSKCLD